MLITATNSKQEYAKEYKECLVKTKTMLPSVLLHSEVTWKYKIKMILITMFPITYAKYSIKKNRKELEKDLKNL